MSEHTLLTQLLQRLMMALPRNLCISFAVTALCFFSLTFPPPESAATGSRNYEAEVIRKMVLGSRPPGCVNKCMNCRPCEATLVIPPHKNSREDDSYYLLSWKCRCGNKLYQP